METSKNETFKKADAFANAVLELPDGSTARFRTGIALYKNRAIDAAAIKDPDVLNKMIKAGKLSFEIHVMDGKSKPKAIKLL